MSDQPSPFQTKICGLTSPADCVAAVVAGPNAVGLNFYSGSRRFLSTAQAAEIVAVLPPEVLAVGVFVDTEPERILEIARKVPLQAVQLHGAESPEDVAVVSRLVGSHAIRTVKALASRSMSAREMEDYVATCSDLGATLDAIMVDAATGSQAGQGKTADWQAAQNFIEAARGRSSCQFLLAGGLSPANVAEAIATVRPDGVDVASGVEASPGVKDPQLMSEFVIAAKRAFRNL